MDIDSPPTKELFDECLKLKKAIEHYPTILIFVQITNDSDTLGSAITLATSIDSTFKDKRKDIYIVGFKQKPKGILIQEKFLLPGGFLMDEKNTLGIAVDIMERRQLPEKKLADKCKEFFIIDHHKSHELKKQMKREVVLIHNDYYKSCSGLIFKILKSFKWEITQTALKFLIRGHHSDSQGMNSDGVWDIYKDLSRMGVDCMDIIENRSRCNWETLRDVSKILSEGERQGKVVILSLTKALYEKMKIQPFKMFTFPLRYIPRNLQNINTLIYWHHFASNTKTLPTHKGIFVVPLNENPALEELLLANNFINCKGWFYRKWDLLEFKEFLLANRVIFDG